MKTVAALSILLALAVSGLSACSNDGVPDEDVAKGVHAETYAVQLPEMKLMDRALKLHWLQEYVTGYAVSDEDDTPAAIRTIPLASSCSLARPAPGSILASVVTDHGNGTTAFYAMDAKDVDEMGKRLADLVRGNRTPALMLAKPDGFLSRIDVVVTETAKPVHLVLASRSGALWNVLTAPGAHLSAVTLISQTTETAVANIAPDVPVSALVGDMAKSCGAIPANEPMQAYPGLRMQIHKAAYPEKELAKMSAAWGSYSSFFLRTYGVSADTVSIGTEALYHVAIGPAPERSEDRVAYKGFKGATIQVTPAALTFYGRFGDYTKARRATAIKTASRLTGGNFQAAMDQAGY